MRIQKVNTQPNFTGRVFTASNLSVRDLEKIRRGADRINAFAKTKNCDFIICKNEFKKGLSIIAKKLDTQKECIMEVLGYPSSSTMNDIDKIVETMKDADDSFTKSKVALGWVCE